MVQSPWQRRRLLRTPGARRAYPGIAARRVRQDAGPPVRCVLRAWDDYLDLRTGLCRRGAPVELHHRG